MSFSNDRVLSALVGRLAFRPSTGVTLDSTNGTTKSGRYFDDFHPLVKASYIKDIMAEAGIDSTTFNAYLLTLQKSAILRIVNAVFPANVTEQAILFDRYGRGDIAVDNADKFVGYKVKVAEGHIMTVNNVRLFLDGVVSVNLKLYHDSNPVALQSVAVVSTASTITDKSLEWELDGNKGGYYYIGYHQSDLGTVKAISEAVNKWHQGLCFGFTPVMLTDMDYDNYGATSRAYGINLEVSVQKDYTSAITRSANAFDEAVGLQLAYMVIEGIINSTRSNATERLTKDGIDKTGLWLDLKGTMPISDAPTGVGLDKRINKAIEAIKQSFFPRKRGEVICL